MATAIKLDIAIASQPPANATGPHPTVVALREGTHEGPIDLRDAYLADMDLSGLDLTQADLSGANLVRAKLRGAQLFGAKLDGAMLVEAEITDADFTAASLVGAILQGAKGERVSLASANLTKANLSECRILHGSFVDSDLTGADMRAADVSDGRFAGATLSEVDATSACFHAADLSDAVVRGAHFDRADLRQAVLVGLLEYTSGSWIGADVRDIPPLGVHLWKRFVGDQNYIQEFRSQGKVAELLYRIWWLTSDCGRSMGRWGICTLIMILAFGGAYTFVEMDYGSHPTWLSPFYFSVVTITTLGYGDVLPASTAGQVVTMAQVLVGYLMLGGLLSILTNKMARRAD